MTSRNPTGDPRWDRLIHLVAGALPADEAADLRRWAEADPERRRAIEQLEGVWRATAPSGSADLGAWDAAAELRRIRQEMGGPGRVIARVGPELDFRRRAAGDRRPHVRAALRAAAALTLLVGGGLMWRRTALVRPPAPAPESAATYRAAPGERLQLDFADGTRVVLAPGSVLRRLRGYGMRGRAVELEGEAYFYVTHDPARPFSVHTAHAVARDLGTRFVVRAYPGDTVSDVVVAEGLVAVTAAPAASRGVRARAPAPMDSVLARPGERVRVTGGGTRAVKDVVALDPYFSWTAGELVFDREGLDDVARRLERWYGVRVRVTDAARRGDYHLTATLREEDAAGALGTVALSLKLVVTRAGDTYVIDRAGR